MYIQLQYTVYPYQEIINFFFLQKIPFEYFDKLSQYPVTINCSISPSKDAAHYTFLRTADGFYENVWVYDVHDSFIPTHASSCQELHSCPQGA